MKISGAETMEKLDYFFNFPRPEPCIEKLKELLEAGSKNKGAVVKLHLENFKEFNETFGFSFGELFLRKIARFLCELKDADVYRTAGVEFIVILEKANASAVIATLNDIAERFERAWPINDFDCMCSVNLAAEYYPGHAGNADEMLEQLDYAITESGSLGPNRYCFFDEKLKQKLYRRNSIARLIPDAVEKDLIEMRYRPSFHNESNRFDSADSYMYLISPEFGRIQLSELIPIAEQTGQIYKISRYAIRKACELISRLVEAGVEFANITVPIAPAQFLQERFVDEVREAIEEYGIPENTLAFEVSQNVSYSGFTVSHGRMDELADLGIAMVSNDFGAGVAEMLNQPVDAVKLGRMLSWQMDNDPSGAALAEGLIHLAKNLGLKIIAEGVETQNQVDLLKQFGADYQQGFHYAPTLSEEELVSVFKGKDPLSVKG